MVAFSFKSRFVLPIELGTKQQTIRNVRKRNARAGDKLQLMTGPRMKPRRIGEAECQLAGPIRIDFERRTIHLEAVDRHGQMQPRFILAAGLDDFARLDGFPDFGNMELFWIETHSARQFTGWWTFWGDTFRGPLDR